MDVLAVTDLNDARRRAIAALLTRADAADGHPALPEPQLLAATQHDGAGRDGLLLAEEGGALVGFALLSPGRDGSAVLHLVVDPGVRSQAEGPEAASSLIARAVADAPHGVSLHLWAMQAGPDDDELARRHGFVPERDLLQMRVPLPLPPEVVAATRPVVTRPFVVGRDEEAWLQTNNAAFAGHPEQGSWTRAQLAERLGADWVDLDGFLLADDPDGAGLIGSCWTKVHRTHRPVLGEIYVIAVDPRHHGQGWGRALTVAGLSWLAAHDAPVGMLYTDATNETAVALYHSLGFTVDHVDRAYRRDPDALS